MIWKPIETAPEDTPILVFGKPWGAPSSEGIQCVMECYRGLWRLIGDQGHEGDYELREPTHWQHLGPDPQIAQR